MGSTSPATTEMGGAAREIPEGSSIRSEALCVPSEIDRLFVRLVLHGCPSSQMLRGLDSISLIEIISIQKIVGIESLTPRLLNR